MRFGLYFLSKKHELEIKGMKVNNLKGLLGQCIVAITTNFYYSKLDIRCTVMEYKYSNVWYWSLANIQFV